MKIKLLDGIAFFRNITLKKTINFLKIQTGFILTTLFRKNIVWGQPYSISIEPASICNLNCPECPTGTNTLKRQKGFMNYDTFQKIIDDIHPYLLFTNLYFQGEPFLNPLFFDFVNYAVKKDIYTSTSTNGHLLNNLNIRKIITSGLNRIIISVDGTDQQTYSAYRKGGEFNLVINGIKNLTEEKKKLKSCSPIIILQFLVLKTNEHQIPLMKILAKQLCVDELQFKSAQFENYSKGNILIPDNKKFSRYKITDQGNWILKKTIKNKCYKMWHSCVISWNGDVVPCCFDKNADYKFGNILDNNLKNIWVNSAYNHYRTILLQNRKSIGICCNCNE